MEYATSQQLFIRRTQRSTIVSKERQRQEGGGGGLKKVSDRRAAGRESSSVSESERLSNIRQHQQPSLAFNRWTIAARRFSLLFQVVPTQLHFQIKSNLYVINVEL